MKLLFGYLTLALALCISGVAAYFSVAGLAAIFPAALLPVIIMGASLEAGKLVSAAWIHANWKNPKVGKFHKSYLIAAIIVLMAITDLGIYGFLAKGHLEQEQPVAAVELNISQKQTRIDQITADLTSLNARQGQVDAAVNAMIGKDAAKGLRARKGLSDESAQIRAKIEADNKELNSINTELAPMKLQVNAVEAKLGPIKFFGQLIGLKDTEAAVRIVILMLMFAFDPLAVVLILSADISISDAMALIAEEKKSKRSSPYRPDLGEPGNMTPEELTSLLNDHAPEPVLEDIDLKNDPHYRSIFPPFHLNIPMPKGVKPPKETLLQELEHAAEPPKDDKELLLEILERKPELLEEVIQVVRETSDEKKLSESKDIPWLDEGLTKTTNQ